mgnify:CR=1 FL=1
MLGSRGRHSVYRLFLAFRNHILIVSASAWILENFLRVVEDSAQKVTPRKDGFCVFLVGCIVILLVISVF